MSRVTVPYLVGLPARRAATRLAELGLRVKAISKPTPKRSGLVVSQKPGAAVALAPGQTVTIAVDQTGPRQIAAPSLVGRSVADARAKLERLGLHAVMTEVASTQQPGTVVDQAPRPGAKLQKGWDVTLSVAKIGSTTVGATTAQTSTAPASTTAPATTTVAATTAPPAQPTSATMPDVGHETEQAAVTELNRAGILASLVFVPGEDPLGTVVQQAKPAGTKLSYHAHVQVNLSTGPGQKQQVAVPNVVGRTLDQAVATLNGAHLRLIFVRFPAASAHPGTVVQQSPLGGAHAPTNAQVLVFLAVRR